MGARAVTTQSADLGERLEELRTRLRETGERAAEAAAGLATGRPPDEALLDELRSVAHDLSTLRERVIAHAEDAGVIPPADLDSAATLETLLVAVAAAEASRARQAAWDAVRTDASRMQSRVESLIHRDDPAFAPLAAAQERARDVVTALPADAPDDVEHAAQEAALRLQPVADLVALAEGWNALDDERCAALQDSIAQALGRPLAAAALRGKIGRVGEPAPAPRTSANAQASVPSLEPADEPLAPFEPAETPIEATPPIAVPRDAQPPPAPPPEHVARPALAPPAPGTSGARPLPSNLAVPASVMPEATPPPSLGDELRLAASEEPAAAREARRAALERRAQTSAPWWTAARDAWTKLRDAGETIESAASKTLARCPHLLAVPLQQSADAGGGLAAGYALLLAHVEKQEPGFVEDALLRLNPELARGAGETYDLGPELYSLVVAEGRLYKTYPDFVRTVLGAVLPEPGVWLSGRVVEEADRTLLARRPDAAGSGTEETSEIRDAKARFATHTLTAALAPLTTRVWRLETTPLEDPTDVEIKLTANGTPSDNAWIVSLPPEGGRPAAPKRHKVGGTTLPAVGKDTGTTWIAVFNPDPKAERRYDLALTLKRKTPPTAFTSKAAAPARGPAKPSPFGSRKS